jgi:hypothetical protein
MLNFCTYEKVASPLSDVSMIEVGVQIIGGYGLTPDGAICVTQTCVTGEEIDEEIDKVIASLERARSDAKARLSENDLDPAA